MKDLLVGANTDEFRAAGGGLYIHHSGWTGSLDNGDQRKAVRDLFAGTGPAVVEFGFGSQWSPAYTSFYLNNGVVADTIIANGLSGKDTVTADSPSVAASKSYIDGLKAKGVKTVSIVLSPNANGTDATSFPFTDARWDDAREIAKYGGAWASDSPPNYFFARGTVYQNWVIAQTKWTKANGLKSINIISPNSAGTNFFNNAVKYVRYFEAKDAIPNQWVVENYEAPGEPAAGYVNRIGSEDNANELSYTANWLIGHTQGRAKTLDLWSSRKTGDFFSNVGHNAFSTSPDDAQVALSTGTDSRTYTINFTNLSTDSTNDFYAPVLSAQAVGDATHWSCQFMYNGGDVTAAVLAGGFTLDGVDLLEAATTKAFTLTIQRLDGASGAFKLNLSLEASPNATVVADTISYAAGASLPEPASLSAIIVAGVLLGRRTRQ